MNAISNEHLRRLLFLTSILFSALCASAQPGRMLLVGGGSEKNGPSSWSTPAYRWAAEGKKVAIIGTSTGTLAGYFTSQCGAARAKEFAIASRDSADSQATYDTLISYDMIFFRGGDQYDYYRYYKGTRLLEAVGHVYASGGTICGTSAGMHILSGVVFTAKYGSAYPDECIENPDNHYVTLADDFLDFFPAFLFDTHFAERGRFGRLAGFMANYYLHHAIPVTGIGMDDMTCMTIDESGLGTVYGTGCANFYLAGTGFTLNGTKLLNDSIRVVQLLQGCTYDFQTGEFGYGTLDRQILTAGMEETGNYTVFASGSDLISDNTGMLTELVRSAGVPSAPVLLLSGNLSTASGFSQKILELGSSAVMTFMPTPATGHDTALTNALMMAEKILLHEIAYEDLAVFLETPNGILLRSRLHTDGMISAFAGNNARYAGKTVVENYLTEYASWYGELTFHPGLALLKHTVIMPQTYLSSDIYENTVTAVPYAMLLDTLKFGIWLTDHSYMKYHPKDGQAVLSGDGAAPLMILRNSGTKGGFASQTSTGSATADPRMVAGFENLTLTFSDTTVPYRMGMVKPSATGGQEGKITWKVFPNPASDRLFFSGFPDSFRWEITDLSGRMVIAGLADDSGASAEVGQLAPGCYFLRVSLTSGPQVFHTKWIKD